MKTIAVVKLNKGAWLDYRENLIQEHKSKGTLVSYSDENVITSDVTYVVKIIPVNTNFLDPLLGFEGNADVTDLLTFINSVYARIHQYTPPAQNLSKALDKTAEEILKNPGDMPPDLEVDKKDLKPLDHFETGPGVSTK